MKVSGDVYLLGDIHGNWRKLLAKIEKYEIHDCTIICVGDVGFGYPRFDTNLASFLDEKLQHRNIKFLAIRGNHDDPTFFDGKRVNLPFMKLLPDYTRLEVNGENWLLIGGAVSIDRSFNVQGISWWAGEEFDFNPEKIGDGPVDVLITHTGPNWLGPNTCDGIVKVCVDREKALGRETLWGELQDERAKMDKLVDIVKPKKLFFGHFHRSQFMTYKGDGFETRGRILNEDELVQYQQ